MCLTLYKPKGCAIDFDLFDNCFRCHPDGIGMMFPAFGIAAIDKGFKNPDALIESYKFVREQIGDTPAVFHFRRATAGAINKANCHPHRIASDLAFVHNGTIHSITTDISGGRSDTLTYRDKCLQGMTGDTLADELYLKRISKHIGKDNALTFMNGTGSVAFCNGERGRWQRGVFILGTLS